MIPTGRSWRPGDCDWLLESSPSVGPLSSPLSLDGLHCWCLPPAPPLRPRPPPPPGPRPGPLTLPCPAPAPLSLPALSSLPESSLLKPPSKSLPSTPWYIRTPRLPSVSAPNPLLSLTGDGLSSLLGVTGTFGGRPRRFWGTGRSWDGPPASIFCLACGRLKASSTASLSLLVLATPEAPTTPS